MTKTTKTTKKQSLNQQIEALNPGEFRACMASLHAQLEYLTSLQATGSRYNPQEVQDNMAASFNHIEALAAHWRRKCEETPIACSTELHSAR
jgi:hypothetical protein